MVKNQNYSTNYLIKEEADKYQKDYENSSIDEQKTSTVTIMIDTEDDSPVNSTNISLIGSKTYEGTANNTQLYTFSKINIGKYQLIASSNGFEDLIQNVTITEGTNEFNITLIKKGISSTGAIGGPIMEEEEGEF